MAGEDAPSYRYQLTVVPVGLTAGFRFAGLPSWICTAGSGVQVCRIVHAAALQHDRDTYVVMPSVPVSFLALFILAARYTYERCDQNDDYVL